MIKAGEHITVRYIDRGKLLAVYSPPGAIQLDDCDMLVYGGIGGAVFAAIDLLSEIDAPHNLRFEEQTFRDGPWEVFTVKEIS